ncbi:F-box domain protein, partial [Oesophagostomum dentatum]
LFQQLPLELHFKILRRIDTKTALNCRAVCRRWNRIINRIAKRSELFKPLELSRLTLTGLPHKALEIRWIAYEAQRSSSFILPHAMIRHRVDLAFNFAQFKVQRIILQNLALTDEFVDFLRLQLAHADLSPLVQLSLNGVDFSQSNSSTLHRLLAPLAKSLEIFELNQSTGMKPDSLTDSHLAQLDATKIRRIAIDGVRFANSHRCATLCVGDESLRRFALQKSFPSLVLDRCAVTTGVICDYTEVRPS